jgi:hypothetical protein
MNQTLHNSQLPDKSTRSGRGNLGSVDAGVEHGVKKDFSNPEKDTRDDPHPRPSSCLDLTCPKVLTTTTTAACRFNANTVVRTVSTKTADLAPHRRTKNNPRSRLRARRDSANTHLRLSVLQNPDSRCEHLIPDSGSTHRHIYLDRHDRKLCPLALEYISHRGGGGEGRWLGSSGQYLNITMDGVDPGLYGTAALTPPVSSATTSIPGPITSAGSSTRGVPTLASAGSVRPATTTDLVEGAGRVASRKHPRTHYTLHLRAL